MSTTLRNLGAVRGGYKKQTFDNTSAMRRGLMKLDEAVSKPVFVDGKNYKDYQCVYNSDKKAPAMITSSMYRIVKHREVFDDFAASIQELGLNGFGTIWNSGNRVIVEISFKGKSISDPSAGHLQGDVLDKNGKTIMLGVRLTNSYDKSMAITGQLFAYRSACANGMFMGKYMKEIQVHQKHIGNINIKARMEKFIGNIINSEKLLSDLVSETIKETLEWKVALKVLEKLFVQPKHREEVLARLGFDMITQIDKKTKEKKYTYIPKKDKKLGKTVSRWDLYNAVTSYLTHGERVSPHMQEWLQKSGSKLLQTNEELLTLVE